MRKRLGFAGLAGWAAFAAVLAGSGCAKRNSAAPIVAVIGEEKIPVTEITDLVAAAGQLFGSPEEELAAKQRLLDSIVEARLLIQEAYRQKLDKDSAIGAFETVERPLFLLDALYFLEVRDKARLSAAEVSDYYRAFQVNRCFKQILTPNPLQADSLLKLLRKGIPFDSLAFVFSKDPVSASKGGDIGCYGWSRKPPGVLFEKTAKMKPGELAGPIRLPEGYLILQCYEQRPAVLPDIRVFEPELRNILEPDRKMRRSGEFVAGIRKELGFRLVDSTARFVNRMQQELSRQKGGPGQPDRFSIYLRTEELSPAQRNMPLAVYQGGVVTAGQYLETQQGSMPTSRLVLDTTERTRAMLFQLVFRDAMVGAARARGLEKDAEFLKRYRQAAEGQMALLLKNRILNSVHPDTARVRAYFNAHPDEFVLPAAVHLFELNRPRREDLLNLRQGIRNKSQFLAMASKFTNRPALRPSGGDLGWVEQHQFPELFAAAAKMKIGEIAGPVFLSDSSFSLVYLEARRASRKQSYAEIKAALFDRLWTKAADSAAAAWLEAQKKKAQVTLYPEVLKKTIDPDYYVKLKEWQDKLKGEAG